MTNTTKLKIGAVSLLVLYLIFGSASFGKKFELCFVLGVAYLVVSQIYSRLKGQHALKVDAAQGMLNCIKESSFKPDYQHFFADGNQVSGVAISKDDSRIILASAAVPAKLFNRDAVLSIASATGTENDVAFKPLSLTGAGDKLVTKVVHVVDVSVRDLDSPRYKLYFETADLMKQWENRLNAWMGMHPTQQPANQ